MNLEIYWLFKEILLRFSYILVIFSDYLLLISSCPVNKVKVWKLPIVPSHTSSLYHNYLKGEGKGRQKFGGFLLNWMKILLICFVFKISTLSKFKSNRSHYITLSITQKLKRKKAVILIKEKMFKTRRAQVIKYEFCTE